MYVMTDADGRIAATSATHHLGEGEFEFDFPQDFDFTRQRDWRLVEGELVHDPLPEEPPQMPSLQEQVDAISAALLEIVLGGELDG